MLFPFMPELIFRYDVFPTVNIAGMKSYFLTLSLSGVFYFKSIKTEEVVNKLERC